jgi:tRNA threonylcarbamoyl adenosine modification protein (Sua5/YciO/YrdC/YwlC family)
MIDAAVAAIRDGQVIGFPTDTVYGLGADPLNDDAVARLFEMKGRPDHKPVGVLVASIEQAVLLGEIEGHALELATEHWPGPLTLVVVPLVILADWVGDAQRRTVGLRVPDHPLAIRLLEETGPLAVTSANVSDGKETVDAEEAKDIFGNDVAEYLPGFSPGGEPSTVVDASGARLSVLRAGPIDI